MDIKNKLSIILNECAKEVENNVRSEVIRKLLTKIEDLDVSSSDADLNKKKELEEISFEEFLEKFRNSENPSLIDNGSWSVLGILYIIHRTCAYYQEGHIDQVTQIDDNSIDVYPGAKSKKNYPSAPQDLISLMDFKNIEKLINHVLYTIYFLSLDKEAAVYLNMKHNQEKINQEQSLEFLSQSPPHKTLLLIMQYLLPIFKHEWIGAHLQTKYFTEIFCGLLQLSFSPSEKKSPHVLYFREELNFFLENKPLLILKSVLLLKGIFAHQRRKSYIQSACQSLYIRRFLLNGNNGLSLIIEVFLSLGPSDDLKRKDALACLVALTNVPDEDLFFQVLGPQILDLLHKSEKNINVFHSLSLILCKLSKRNSDLTQKYIFESLLNPLKSLTQEGDFSSTCCDNLISAIDILHKIYLDMVPHEDEFHLHLENVLCPIYDISLLPSTCHVKSKAKKLIERYLNNLDKDAIVSTLLAIVGLEKNEKMPSVRQDITLKATINSISIESNEIGSLTNDWDEKDEKKINSLIEIFDNLRNCDYIIDVFEKLASFIDFTIFNNIEGGSNSLLLEEDIDQIKFERIRRITFAVGVISCVSENEKLTQKIFKNITSALNIFKILLESHRQQCFDAELSSIKDMCVTSSVTLLVFFVDTSHKSGKLKHEDWIAFKDIIAPPLKDIASNSTNEFLVMIVTQLLNNINTHGVIKSAVGNDKTQTRESKTFESKVSMSTYNKNNYTSSSSGLEKNSATKTNKNSSANINNTSLSPFREVINDLCSPFIPISGHGLISLKKLIIVGDTETLKNVDKVMSLLEHFLKHDDSYIYLAAVECLSSLASRCPDKVISILTEEFTLGKQTTETRLKLIEILTNTARGLEHLLPKYKNLFLNCVLNGVKDEDGYIRASCLSNLGELCKLLRFGIETVLFEIFSLVDDIIKKEKCPEVKRASVLLITLLLQGLGKDSLRVLQSVMLDIYRGLKQILRDEDPVFPRDPILVTHAQLAMDEINSATRQFLLPQKNLSKKIYVTEVPPNFL